MDIRYACTYWGEEGTKASLFFARALKEDYDGVEINLPESEAFIYDFLISLDNLRAGNERFGFIAQQVLSPADESVDEYLSRMTARLEFLATLKPDFINSHTGKDYFSFDDNCRIIEAAENIAARSGIPILHETHRGRFTFHAASLLPYLEKFPHLKLTGDFSHWCTVSESMLQDQKEIMETIIPRIHHIHARVGYEQSPQVNDAFAPEWKQHMDTFVNWWRKIIETQSALGKRSMTITPEFGPVPYMPTLPHTQKPLADQWQLNTLMKVTLKRKFSATLTHMVI
jgi:hypothetical protein